MKTTIESNKANPLAKSRHMPGPYKPNFPRAKVSAICEPATGAAGSGIKLKQIKGWESFAQPSPAATQASSGSRSVRTLFHETRVDEHNREILFIAVLAAASLVAIFLSLVLPLSRV